MDMDLKKVDQGKIKAFFMFDLLVLPWLVKVLFILGVIGILLSGVAMPFKAAAGLGSYDFATGHAKSDFSCGTFAIAALFSVIFTVIGIVWWRVVCESMIILFKIHDVLVPRKPLDSTQGKPEEPKAAAAEAAAAKPDAPPPAPTA